MSDLQRRIADLKRVVSQWPMAGYKVDAIVKAAKAEAWDKCAAEVEECHDCLAYRGVTNPYREAVTE